MEKLGFKVRSLCVMKKKIKMFVKRKRLVLIPMLLSKENGSQGACPLLNRDCRSEEVNLRPYVAQGQSQGMHRDPGG